ncbi:MAG: glycoside hydrolase family 32 protein [Dictyoglomus sp.]|jgi:beta-fructofuranosidase|uniref:glycoside hydrolase family 32 protein n=1 Tax=Dictyoglomus sp. TaxID=28205 RepID=UPI003D1011DD
MAFERSFKKVDKKNAYSQLEKANLFVKEHKKYVNPKYRLVYHLMGEYGWINDPNGFIYFNGIYHCFYQHNPFNSCWGPTYWGHAISEDLVKWQYLPIALAPDSEYDKDGCFSGSAIERDGKIYILYTGHVKKSDEEYMQTQCLAWSTDTINFIKYEGNPVIGLDKIPGGASKKDFRDPKVFKRGDKYYVLVASKDLNGKGQILFYESHNLIDWNFVNILFKSDIDREHILECPDFFSIDNKDVLIFSIQYIENNKVVRSETRYCTGLIDWNKGVFNLEYCDLIDYGTHFYAPQTTLGKNGCRVMIAWMDVWEREFPTHKLGHNWAGALILPREIYLKGNKLFFRPIKEIEKYRKNEQIFEGVLEGEHIRLPLEDNCFELDMTAEFFVNTEMNLELLSREDSGNDLIKLTFKYSFGVLELTVTIRDSVNNNENQSLLIDSLSSRLNLRLFMDKSSLEMFINEGEKVITKRVYPFKKYDLINISSQNACKVRLKKWNLQIT